MFLIVNTTCKLIHNTLLFIKRTTHFKARDTHAACQQYNAQQIEQCLIFMCKQHYTFNCIGTTNTLCIHTSYLTSTCFCFCFRSYNFVRCVSIKFIRSKNIFRCLICDFYNIPSFMYVENCCSVEKSCNLEQFNHANHFYSYKYILSQLALDIREYLHF